MEYLDSDMDDLFQKAGELYPLKTKESDWDAVAGKLQDENFGDANVVPGLTAKRTRNKRKWLLVLIPLGLAGLVYTSGLVKNGRGNSVSVKPVTDNEQTGSNLKNPVVVNKSSSREGILHKKTQETKKDIGNAQSNESIKAKNDLHSKNENKVLEEGETLNTNKQLNNTASSSAEYSQKSQALPVPSSVSEKNETASTKNNTSTAETFKTASPDNSLTKKKTDVYSNSSRGVYVGLVAGPDVSTVAFQSIRQTGFSLGALIGYRFNKRLAIETGFLWDKKYYYSDGAHYKDQSAGYNIINVDGSCNMFEIPLALRYDFASKKNSGFFAKAGLSSYLMTKQNYSYTAEANGSQYSWTAPPDYTAMNYIFSIVQVSAGYEFSISGKTKIRIEPYVKIPLQGIGVGSMPISSAGIYFGVTHSFR